MKVNPSRQICNYFYNLITAVVIDNTLLLVKSKRVVVER